MYTESGHTTLTAWSTVSVINGGSLTLLAGAHLTLQKHAQLYVDHLSSAVGTPGAGGSVIATAAAQWTITNLQGACIGGLTVPLPSADWGFTPAVDQC